MKSFDFKFGAFYGLCDGLVAPRFGWRIYTLLRISPGELHWISPDRACLRILNRFGWTKFDVMRGLSRHTLQNLHLSHFLLNRGFPLMIRELRITRVFLVNKVSEFGRRRVAFKASCSIWRVVLLRWLRWLLLLSIFSFRDVYLLWWELVVVLQKIRIIEIRHIGLQLLMCNSRAKRSHLIFVEVILSGNQFLNLLTGDLHAYSPLRIMSWLYFIVFSLANILRVAIQIFICW